MLKGLKVGDVVATSASFLIDSEGQLQAAAGAYTPPPPGAGTEMGATTEQLSAELTTNPSPPNKGKNEVKVKLTSADGKPLAGAKVTVRFFMPAMSEMGMPAMNMTTSLNDKGNGVHAGEVELGSGGTWQVTIRVEQGGRILLTKHISLVAIGGM